MLAVFVFSSSQNSQTSYFRNDGLINRLVLGQEYSATLWDLTKNKEKIVSFSFSACKVSFPLWRNQDFNHVMIMRSLFCNMKRSVSKFFHHTRKLGDKARPEDFVDIIIKQLRPIRLDASSWQDKASLPTHQSYFLPQSLHRRCVSLQINQELLNARVGNITPQQKPRASLTKNYKWLLSVYFDLALFANYLLSKSTTQQHFDIDIPCSYNHQGLPRRQGCPLWSLPQTYPFARPCPAPSSFQLPKRKPTGRERSEIWGGGKFKLPLSCNVIQRHLISKWTCRSKLQPGPGPFRPLLRFSQVLLPPKDHEHAWYRPFQF